MLIKSPAMADVPAPPPPSSELPAPPAPLPPELLPAQQALDRGDFRRGRELVSAVLAGNPAADLASSARALLAPTEVDPWAVRLGLIACGLLALVIGAYIL